MGDFLEITELESKLARMKEERVKFDAMPERQRLAQILHKKQWDNKHPDGSIWFYETWINSEHSRNSYLDKADKLLTVTDYETIVKIVKYL